MWYIAYASNLGLIGPTSILVSSSFEDLCSQALALVTRIFASNGVLEIAGIRLASLDRGLILIGTNEAHLVHACIRFEVYSCPSSWPSAGVLLTGKSFRVAENADSMEEISSSLVHPEMCGGISTTSYTNHLGDRVVLCEDSGFSAQFSWKIIDKSN